MPEREGRGAVSAAVLLIGAAAGLAVALSLIGALVSWGRFYALDVPSDAASSTLAQSTLLLRGANALAGPVVAGLAAAGLSLLLRSVRLSRPREIVVAVALISILTAATAVFAPWPLFAYVPVAGLLVALSLTPLGDRVGRQVAAYSIFAAVVGMGICLLVWGILRPPTYLERAEVTFANGTPPLNGFWIADTANTVYVAPQVGGADGPCQVTGEVIAIPREDVRSIRFRPAVAIWPANRAPTPDACA